jgi:uncharacterized membrane protein YebE (DUF533 family)
MASTDWKILQAWSAAAWADGVLHPAEKRALLGFIASASGLTEAERAAADGLLSTPQVLDVGALRSLSKDEREGVLRAAKAMIGVDRAVSPGERDWLAFLRSQVDLDDKTLSRIDRD